MNFNNFFVEEDILYSQIQNYDISQKIIKRLIDENIPAEIELYIINDEFLNQWKKKSCFDEIKFNLPLKNPQNWRKIRYNNNADNNIVIEINNMNLIKCENNGICTNITINPKSKFDFITKECFECFAKNTIIVNNLIIKTTFISHKNKLISKYNDKIFVLYKHQRNLNFLLFTLKNPKDNFFFKLKKKVWLIFCNKME